VSPGQLKMERERRQWGSALMGKMKMGGHRLASTKRMCGRVANNGTRRGGSRSDCGGSGAGGGRQRRAWAGWAELGLATWAGSREKGHEHKKECAELKTGCRNKVFEFYSRIWI
jgi:hypothetical protein